MWEFWCGRAALELLQRWSGAGESIQRDYSNLSPMAADVQLLCHIMLNTGGSSGVFKLPKGALKWSCSEFCLFSGCKLWVRRLSQISGFFFFWSLPTLIEWFLEAGWVCDTLWWSLTDVWYQVVKHCSSYCTLYSQSVFFSFKWIYKYAEKLSWGISYHPNFTFIEWCPISA